jgi:hypothetical protein
MTDVVGNPDPVTVRVAPTVLLMYIQVGEIVYVPISADNGLEFNFGSPSPAPNTMFVGYSVIENDTDSWDNDLVESGSNGVKRKIDGTGQFNVDELT